MTRLPALLLLAVTATAADAPDVKLPWRLVELENGLRLLMQPDPSMAEVGVEFWIRGGSREEAPGPFGVAHLFEHDLQSSGRFLGNPANRAAFSGAARATGAGTEPDFLRFYNIVAPAALEASLGALADRLESDESKYTEENLRRDQDIVISELRRNMGSDWDVDVLAHLHRGTFGSDHPYGHSVSGSEREVRAATVDVMREWHRRFAGASNTILFLVGNFDPVQAEALVRRHFGPIPPGTPAPRMTSWVPAPRAIREVLEKDVQRGVVYVRWPIPAWGTEDADHLTLLAHVLNQRLPSGLTARVELRELAGTFTLRGELADRVAADATEQTMRKELERVLRDGPTADELARVKVQQQTDFVRLLQRPVWRFSRADVLGFGLLYRNDPDHYRRELARVAAATPAALRETGTRWLTSPGYTLHVLPRRALRAVGTIDRAASVAVPAPQPPAFPLPEMFTLNGAKVIVAPRRALPLVQLTFAFDPVAAESLRALQASLNALGASPSVSTDNDYATLSLSVLSNRVESAIRAVTVPNVRVIAASGDIDRATFTRLVSAQWSAAPEARRMTTVARMDTPGYRIVPNPAATQMQLRLSIRLPATVATDPLMAQLVTYALRSRLMTNLRTTRGWSYEIYPFEVDVTRGYAAMRFTIPVQTDKTAETIKEVRAEIEKLRNEEVTPELLGSTRSYVESGELTAGLGSLERMNAQLLELARNDLPAAYYGEALRRLAAVTPADLLAAAKQLLDPPALSWVITGEPAAIQRELAELGIK